MLLTTAIVFGLARTSLGAVFRGAIEGDTQTQFYVNSIPIGEDLGYPILPLNTVRQVLAMENPGYSMRIDFGEFAPGDTLAVEVTSTRAEEEPWVNALGEIYTFDGLAGFIGAWADGTMTSSAWRCSTVYQDLWFAPDFAEDATWTAAKEQAPDCCPWRDVDGYWGKLSAHWIGPDVAGPGPRTFYCRYTVPSANTSRLPQDQWERASSASANLTILDHSMGTSVSMVTFTVSAPAKVACGVVDPRYWLRTPTAPELLDWGASGYFEASQNAWELVAYRTDIGYSTAAIAWLNVVVIEECQDACWGQPSCLAMTFYEDGTVDPDTLMNCKLMRELDPAELDTEPTDGVVMVHYQIVPAPIVHNIAITGLLYPGTLYNIYCATEHPDVSPFPHSTWQEVEATLATERTDGCADCSAFNQPSLRMMGGWADDRMIVAILMSDTPGRIFCAPVPGTGGEAPTGEEIKRYEMFGVVTLTGVGVPVFMAPVANASQYEVFCTAESDGAVLSDAETVEESRRPWKTEAVDVPIETMELSLIETSSSNSIGVVVSVREESDVYCVTLNASDARVNGTPSAALIIRDGLYQRVKPPDVLQGNLEVPLNSTAEAYCTAFPNNATDNGTSFGAAYPIATIDYSAVNFNTISLYVRVDRGPAGVFCLPLMWATKPVTTRPPLPSQEDMYTSPYGASVFEINGGVVFLEMTRLEIGALYDVYCYAEEYTPPTPAGAVPPPRFGMDEDAIKETRTTLQTEGPVFQEGGWHCVVGGPCNITGLEGHGRTSSDRVQAKLDVCPGDCQCAGVEDEDRKGAECSDVSQRRDVAAPVPGSEPEIRDPKGEWCYVSQDTLCGDAEPSPHFDGYLVSYLACTYEAQVALPGSGPPGFPLEGIGVPMDVYGDSFAWTSEPLYVAGAPYELCWCNGTRTECKYELNFHLKMGLLHVTGPSAAQMNRTMTCIAGSSCSFEHYEGHALTDGARLAVLPVGPQGCSHEKVTASDPEPVPGFPQLGVSSAATDGGRTFSWGLNPVQSGGGVFALCWCGRLAADGTRADCPAERPDGGAGFLAAGGYLEVIGPYFHTAFWYRNCSIGVPCTMRDVGGRGLRGGDVVGAFRTCGEATPPPPSWFLGEVPEGWESGGWLANGPEMTHEQYVGIAAPIPEVTEAYYAGALPPRGVFGFPNQGASDPDPLPGFYPFTLPVWAFSGDYMLCWCPGSYGADCTDPLLFGAAIGTLKVVGPEVLPHSHQGFSCIRGGRCEIQYLAGTQLVGSQIFIAEEACGGAAPFGVPNYGFSQPSPDGHFFTWSDEGITSAPGTYLLCWCAVLGNCFQESDYGSFAATLMVKGPLSPAQNFVCNIREQCNITGIYGVGLTGEDSAMVLTVCGHGHAPDGWTGGAFSVATLDNGQVYTLPPAKVSGNWRVCWCPEESMCASPLDFFVDLGTVWVTGPDAAANYQCYEWLPCVIEDFVGMHLEDGNRIRVTPFGTDCTTGVDPLAIPGFPLEGIPIPAVGSGRVYTFGDENIMATVDRYSLCWCQGDPDVLYNASNPNHTEFCGAPGTFTVPAGTLHILSYESYLLATDSKEPPDQRNDDLWWVYLLALPFPCCICMAIVVVFQKFSSRFDRTDVEAPPLLVVHQAWASAAKQKAKKVSPFELPGFRTDPVTVIAKSPGHDAFGPGKDEPAPGGSKGSAHVGSSGDGNDRGGRHALDDRGFCDSGGDRAGLCDISEEAHQEAIANARLGVPFPPQFAPPPPPRSYTPNPRLLELMQREDVSVI